MKCTRGPDHRKAITRQHEQNLRQQIDVLTERLRLKDQEVSQLRSHSEGKVQTTLSPAVSPLLNDQRLLLSPRSPYLEAGQFTDASQSDDNRSDRVRQAVKATPCSESDESSSESDSDESEDEIINVEGKTNLFVGSHAMSTRQIFTRNDLEGARTDQQNGHHETLQLALGETPHQVTADAAAPA